MISQDLKKELLRAETNEITEHNVYKNLAGIVRIKEQAEVLKKISAEELTHYEFFKGLTGEKTNPDKFKLFLYTSLSKIFGLNFGLRLMEKGECLAQGAYTALERTTPEIKDIIRDEKTHEYALLDLIDEERLKYAGSVILGLNDALVELTATLAGFTLALQNTKLVGMLGLITGIAAAMSMAAAEYLSTKHDKTAKNPAKASIYTGITYIATVLLLVLPYFLLSNIFASLALAIAIALLIILIFTFYISVAKNLDFRHRFLEMAGLSLSIAAITFFIGLIVRKVFGINI